jgi:hypothetical protein
MEAGSQHHTERIDAGRQQPLELVALGELELGQAVGFGVRRLELRRQRAQPRRGRRRIAARADDIPEDDDSVHRVRLTEVILAVNG